MRVRMDATWPVTLRRAVVVISVLIPFAFVLIAAEAAVGIGFGWRLLLNQVPLTVVMVRVDRWLR